MDHLLHDLIFIALPGTIAEIFARVTFENYEVDKASMQSEIYFNQPKPPDHIPPPTAEGNTTRGVLCGAYFSDSINKTILRMWHHGLLFMILGTHSLRRWTRFLKQYVCDCAPTG